MVANKVYDGTTTATISSAATTFTGILTGDTNYINISGTYVANFVDKNIGVGKTVNITGMSLSGSLSANYTMAAELRLEGRGLTLPDGPTVQLNLQPGRSVTTVKVVAARGEHVLDARLTAGTTTLDEITHSVRFLTLKGALPFIVVGCLVFVAGVFFLIRWFLKKRKPASAPRWMGMHRHQ